MKNNFGQKIWIFLAISCFFAIMTGSVLAASATARGECGSGEIKLGCKRGTAQAVAETDNNSWYCIYNGNSSELCKYITSESIIPDQAEFGSIAPALGDYGDISTGEDGLAEPIKFANRIIAFSTTVIGIWFLINIILQGIKIINNSKDPKAFNESVQKILWSIAGIALVALAYVIAGWVSAQLFGNTTTILNPSI